MPDTPKIPGLVQKKDGSYGFTVECPNGFITKEILKAAHEVCRNFNCRLHITTAQKLMFLDLDQESGARAVELLEKDLQKEIVIEPRPELHIEQFEISYIHLDKGKKKQQEPTP